MRNFFQKKNKFSDGLFREIEAACEGLVYMSETDSEVRSFAGTRVSNLTRDVIIQQTGMAAETPVEEANFGTFFTRLTAAQPWHGEAEKARAEKFLVLQKLLEENLRDRKVFRIGRIRLDIYAVGIDKDGTLIGIKTNAVET